MEIEKSHEDLGQETKEGAQAEYPLLVVKETVQFDFSGRIHWHEWAVYLSKLYLGVYFDRMFDNCKNFIFVELDCDNFTFFARNLYNRATGIEKKNGIYMYNLLSTSCSFSNDWLYLMFTNPLFVTYASLGLKITYPSFIPSELFRDFIGFTIFARDFQKSVL